MHKSAYPADISTHKSSILLDYVNPCRDFDTELKCFSPALQLASSNSHIAIGIIDYEDIMHSRLLIVHRKFATQKTGKRS